MKLPRDLSGPVLIRLLAKLGYAVTRQTGSHVRLTTLERGEHHITIPTHDPLRIGTLAASALTKIDPFSLTKCAPPDAQKRTCCAARRAIEKRQALASEALPLQFLKPTGCFWGGWKRRPVAVSRAGCGFMQPGAASLDTAKGRYALAGW